MAVSGVVINVLSSALWAGMGAATLWVWRPSYRYLASRRPIARLLNRSPKRSIIVIQSAVKSVDPTEYFKFLVTPDCVTGYALLNERLRDVGYRSDQIFLRFPTELTQHGLSTHDIALIGGYENNQMSADLNSGTQPLYLKDNKIYVKGREEPYDIELSADGRVLRDYCLVSRRPNPFAEGKKGGSWVVGFEGIRHYGTEAGIRFVTPDNLGHAVFAKARQAKEIYIVISCGVAHLTDASYSLKDIRIELVWIDGRLHNLSEQQ